MQMLRTKLMLPWLIIAVIALFATTAVNANQESGEQAVEPPGLPGPLSGESTAEGIRLTWSAPGDGGAATDYQILRRIPGESTALAVYATTGGTATTYTDTSATDGTTYVYRVVASNGAGLGPRSNFVRTEYNRPPVAQGQSSGEPQELPASPPGAPAGLTATATAGGMHLNWTAPEGEVTGYQILRRIPTACEQQLAVHLENTGDDATEWTDTDVVHGNRYVYRVKAINAAGIGPQSNFATATFYNLPYMEKMWSGQAQGLGKPSGLTATVMAGSVLLEWTAPADDTVTGYRILRRMPTECQESLLIHQPDTDSTDSTYLDTAVSVGQTYVYRVVAIHGEQFSGQSNYVKITVKEIEESLPPTLIVMRSLEQLYNFYPNLLTIGVSRLPLDSDATTIDATLRGDARLVNPETNSTTDADACEGTNMGTDIHFMTIKSSVISVDMIFGGGSGCDPGEYEIEIVVSDGDGEEIASKKMVETVGNATVVIEN